MRHESSRLLAGLPRVPWGWMDRPRLNQVLDALAPVTVVRGTVGMGKTALLAAWAERRVADGDAVAWVTVAGETVTGQDFWAQVRAGMERVLGDAGPMDVETTDADVAWVRRAVGGLESRLVLVVTGLHKVVDATVADLVELAFLGRHLHLVVATRRRLAVESDPTADVAAITPADLLLTAQESDEVMASAVPHLTPAERELLHERVGGWPALVHLVARSGALEKLSGERLAVVVAEQTIAYLRDRVLPVTAADGSMEAACVLSVADELTPDLADSLIGDHTGRRWLTRFAESGAIVMADRAEGRVSSFADVVRTALRGMLRETDPERFRALNLTASRWFLARGDVHRALVHAHDAEAWQDALQIIDTHLVRLVVHDFALLVSVVRVVPDEVIARQVRWQVVRTYMSMLVGIRGPHGDVTLPEGEPALEQMAAEGRARDACAIGLAQMMMLRGAGYLDAAGELADRLTAVVTAARRTNRVQTEDLMPLLHLHLGISRLLTNQISAATTDFHLAYRYAVAGRADFFAFNAAGDLALVHAVSGDLPTAEQWIERAIVYADVDSPFMVTARVGLLCAQALVALGRLDLPAAARYIEAAGDPARREELWGFIVHARVRHGLLTGVDVAELRRAVEVAKAAHPDVMSLADSTTQVLLRAALADLAVVEGRGSLADGVLAAAGNAPWAEVRRARVALLSGEPDLAVAAATAVRWDGSASQRDLVDASVIEAAAALRLGREADAAAAFGRAVRSVQVTGQVDVLATIQREERERLAALVRSGGAAGEVAVLHHPTLASQPAVFPPAVERITLSEREAVVLRRLAQGTLIEQIAAELYVSVNTVKTQVRSVYRKLGVHGRDEAVAVARAQGLLVD